MKQQIIDLSFYFNMFINLNTIISLNFGEGLQKLRTQLNVEPEQYLNRAFWLLY